MASGKQLEGQRVYTQVLTLLCFPVTFDLSGDDECDLVMHEPRFRFRSNRPPKSDIPKFNGDNPKWWKKTCEKYFAMYEVDEK